MPTTTRRGGAEQPEPPATLHRSGAGAAHVRHGVRLRGRSRPSEREPVDATERENARRTRG